MLLDMRIQKAIYFSAAICLSLLSCAVSPAQATKDAVVFPSATGAQTETDEYTRYELLAPETASFKIYYEVTATTAGAKYFYNPIRKGSVASDESVFDAMTGKPLEFAVASGAEAKKDPLMAKADEGTDYIKVTLARPVPENGQGRVVIVKTYKDAKSYYVDGKTIVFNRPLGIKRNKVVLPVGYEVVGLTVPSQIRTEKDGRIAISFMHAGTGEAPLVLKAVKDAQMGAAAMPKELTSAKSWEASVLPGSRSGRGCRRGLIRIAILFIFCSSRRRMRSACITTTRRGGRGLMDMRMWCGRGVWRVILRLTCSIPGRS
ncbi:MAG: hypothetical protein WDN23_00245 [Edaphobacter sp.]